MIADTLASLRDICVLLDGAEFAYARRALGLLRQVKWCVISIRMFYGVVVISFVL